MKIRRPGGAELFQADRKIGIQKGTQTARKTVRQTGRHEEAVSLFAQLYERA
jgi:hypothetical protein